MAERGPEALNGTGVQGVAPQLDGVKDLTTKEILALPIEDFEKRLDGIFGEKRSDVETVKPEEQAQEEDKRSVVTQVAAAAVAATLLGGAGVALSPTGANAETNVPTKKVIIEGSFASDEALDKIGVKASAGTSDVTPAAQPTPLGPEATPSLLDLVDDEYIKETQEMFMDFDSPLPIERIKNCVEADRIRTLEDNKNFFRNLGVDDVYWLEVGAKGLYGFDNQKKFMGLEGSFVNYISREEFIEKIVNGDNKDFFCDKEGHPLFLLVNFTDKMKKDLKAGADKLEKGGIDNLYESWHDSGVWILCADFVSPGAELTQSLINQWGVINFNFTMDIPKAKKINLPNLFARNMTAETIGIDYLQLYRALRLYNLGLNEHYAVLCDNVKNVTASKIMANLNNGLKIFEEGLFLEAQDGADRENVPIDGDLTQRLTEATLAVYEIPGENLLEGKK